MISNPGDIEPLFQEFMDQVFSGDPKVFEENVLAELLARKINVLSEKERHVWLIRILGYMGAATNRAVLSGRELNALWEISEN
jgi:hypothetical protein